MRGTAGGLRGVRSRSDDQRTGSAPLTLSDLHAIPVTALKGVGPKKADGLEELGVTTVLDLLTFYPRRWVDRTNEARVGDLRDGEEALVLVTVRSTHKHDDPHPQGDGHGRDRRRVWAGCRLVFFNQAWRERQLTPGPAGRALRAGRVVPRPAHR